MTKWNTGRLLSVCSLVALSLGFTGFCMLFTTFLGYDDEGYVLWSARQFCEGKPLYTEVFSQYGPMFYAWYRAWHGLAGLVFTSESARWLTLGYWLIAAASCGYVAAWLTRQWLVGIAASIMSFAALEGMINEPFHPGGFLAAVVSVATAVGLTTLQRHRTRTFVVSGAIFGIAMALTKINVGAFFMVALAAWVALHSGGRKWGSVAFAAAVAAIILTPLVLMKTHRVELWVETFAIVFAAGALAVLINFQRHRHADFRWTAWGWMAAAGGLVVTILAVFCVRTGTPALHLWDAIVGAPLRHPGVNVYSITWRKGACGLALLSLALAIADRATNGRLACRGTVVACLRLLGGFPVLAQLTGWGYDLPFHAVFQFGPALAWLMATPLEAGAPDEQARGRSWLAWCSIWQILQAYPVGGSQVSWGCFLFVPLLATGCFDAICFLGGRLPRPQWVPAAASGVLLTIAVIANCELAANALKAYRRNEPFGLPGARTLRLPARFTGEARAISRNAAVHAGVLFTSPGLLSFNIWSEKPTPTAANVTVWRWLLSDAQKSAITTRLREDHTAMIASQGPRNYNPNNYLDSYRPVVRVGEYTLWAWKGRRLLPLNLVSYRETPEGRASLVFAADPTERRIVSMQVREIESRGVTTRIAVEPGHSWRVTPVDLQARPTGATTSRVEPFTLGEYSLVQVEIDSSLAGVDLDTIDAVLTDATGTVVESFRFNKVANEEELLH